MGQFTVCGAIIWRDNGVTDEQRAGINFACVNKLKQIIFASPEPFLSCRAVSTGMKRRERRSGEQKHKTVEKFYLRSANISLKNRFVVLCYAYRKWVVKLCLYPALAEQWSSVCLILLCSIPLSHQHYVLHTPFHF